MGSPSHENEPGDLSPGNEGWGDTITDKELLGKLDSNKNQ